MFLKLWSTNSVIYPPNLFLSLKPSQATSVSPEFLNLNSHHHHTHTHTMASSAIRARSSKHFLSLITAQYSAATESLYGNGRALEFAPLRRSMATFTRTWVSNESNGLHNFCIWAMIVYDFICDGKALVWLVVVYLNYSMYCLLLFILCWHLYLQPVVKYRLWSTDCVGPTSGNVHFCSD